MLFFFVLFFLFKIEFDLLVVDIFIGKFEIEFFGWIGYLLFDWFWIIFIVLEFCFFCLFEFWFFLLFLLFFVIFCIILLCCKLRFEFFEVRVWFEFRLFLVYFFDVLLFLDEVLSFIVFVLEWVMICDVGDVVWYFFFFVDWDIVFVWLKLIGLWF